MDKMTRIIISLIFLGWCGTAFAMKVGGGDIELPANSAYLKTTAVNKALDTYEAYLNLRAGLDMEFVVKRKLSSSSEVSGIELDGQNYVFKISNNFKHIIEPYIKIGTSNLKVEWNQNGNKARVESEMDLMWGAGIKSTLYELKDQGIKLTLDAQYREYDMDVDECKLGGSSAGLSNANFDIKEWQIGLLVSKRLILPIGLKDYYIVPYGGLTFLSSDVDVSFQDSSTGLLYSTYNASEENNLGLVLGCDIMPSLSSWYLLNFELTLVNELAFSIGGTMKF